MHRRYRRSRDPKEDHRRLRLSPIAARRLSDGRRRKVGRICPPTKIKLERLLRLFQTRRKRHRTETGQADDGLAGLRSTPLTWMSDYAPTSRRPIAAGFRRTAEVATKSCVRHGIHPD